MNSTFGIWIIGAGVVAVALLLLFGAPVAQREVAPELDLAPDTGAAGGTDTTVATSSYWQSVVAEEPVPAAVAAPVSTTSAALPMAPITTSAVAPCPSCGAATATVPSPPAAASSYRTASAPCGRPSCTVCGGQATYAAPARSTDVPLVGGCGYPSAPCGRPSCTVCRGRMTPPAHPATYAAPAHADVPLVGGCGYPSTPCGRPSCSKCYRLERPAVTPVPEPANVHLVGGCGLPSTPCGHTACYPATYGCYDVCTDPCRKVKPGINRNMAPCVNEYSFIQLRSTVAHPLCEQVRFEWSASKGWFLDPTVSDPLFFSPTTQFCDGEDVWITLVVTDAAGAQYSDAVSLHIRDLP